MMETVIAHIYLCAHNVLPLVQELIDAQKRVQNLGIQRRTSLARLHGLHRLLTQYFTFLLLMGKHVRDCHWLHLQPGTGHHAKRIMCMQIQTLLALQDNVRPGKQHYLTSLWMALLH